MPQILNVNPAGVIKVLYLSETDACDIPLMSPLAPKKLMKKVNISKTTLYQAFFYVDIFLPHLYYFNNSFDK